MREGSGGEGRKEEKREERRKERGVEEESLVVKLDYDYKTASYGFV